MENTNTRTAEQALLLTIEKVGRESAIDLFKEMLPQLEARLAVLQSITDVENAAVMASRSISSVNLYGSKNHSQLILGLCDRYYSNEQLPEVINSVYGELKASIKALRDYQILLPTMTVREWRHKLH